ncbi:protein AKNAD1 [Pseudophryne corroboree]|uniref:protein AKNAD1 n=1 Tax=Pseudophryne corroboree TaxID=495146 RepID=UPI0030813172
MHAAYGNYMEFATDNNVSTSQKPSEQLEESWGTSASDNTDDEQEDLPFDGILECYLVPNLDQDQVNQPGILSASHTALISLQEMNSEIDSETADDDAIYSMESSDVFSLSETVSKHVTEADGETEHESEKLITIPTIIPDVLLRHFTGDGLLSPCDFIDYETMPEISIAESSSETVISRKSYTELSQCDFSTEQQEDFEDEYLELYQNENIDIQEEVLNNENNPHTDENSPKENTERNVSECIQESVGFNELLPDCVDDKSQYPKYNPERRPSYEIKYGQGQVHYKLPDFSKVLPKVKIPKGDIGVVKSFPALTSVVSSPNLVGQSFAIQDILDSMQPCMQQEQRKEAALSSDHLHIQGSEASLYTADFNKIISIATPASECFTPDSCQSVNHIETQAEGILLELCTEDAPQTSKSAEDIKGSQSTEGAEVPTEGEKMSRILAEQAQKLKMKGTSHSQWKQMWQKLIRDHGIESFTGCLFKKSLPRKEELLTFQNLKLCLESLELNYLSAKEKHRDLQLQIYRTNSQTVGEFDLERDIEGQIFRLGMLLEDIQEQINQSEDSVTVSASPTTPQETHSLPYPEKKTGHTTDPMVNNINEVEILSQEEEMAILLPGSCCQEDKMAKTQRKVSKPGTLSIFIPEKAANLDFPDCDETADYFRSNWLVSSHSSQRRNLGTRGDRTDVSKGQSYKSSGNKNIHCESYNDFTVSSICSFTTSSSSLPPDKYSNEKLSTRHRCKLLNNDTTTKDLHEQKSLWASKIPVYMERQSSFSNSLCLKSRKVSQAITSSTDKSHKVSHPITSSRPKVKTSASHHSQFAVPGLPSLQRRSWPCVTRSSLDCIDIKTLNSILDQALRTAKSMQRTSERMVQQLTADMVNRPPYSSSDSCTQTYPFHNKI